MTIRAVGVVVPAHDEAATIGIALDSILAAVALTPIPVVIVIVDDRSCDGTACRAQHALAGHEYLLIRQERGNVGRARHTGVLAALGHFAGLAAADIWVATTDADSWVPNDWLLRQLAHADSGADAVAGIISLDDCEPSLRDRFERRYADGMTGASHQHVHGANLGFRGSVYKAAGGFPLIGCGEDNALWAQLTDIGAVLVSDPGLRVVTSARTRSRARGGLGTLLGTLVEGLPSSVRLRPR